MSNNLDKIIEALPGDLSEAGIREIHSLLNEVVDERVAAEVSLLESKVSGFLRTKIEQLKEAAMAELKATDETYRAVKIYEAVKTLVAADITSEDQDSLANSYAGKISELEETVKKLNTSLEFAAQENHLLESKLDSTQNEFSSLMEENKNLQEKAELPFRSSESAVVITNENNGSEEYSQASLENQFLTEDVVRLSRTFTEDK
tara:strand:- start:622 stop:1233 length:612 start_codon:yes stop_codon:yes gene_type:complete